MTLKHVIISAREFLKLPFPVRHRWVETRTRWLAENIGNELIAAANEPMLLDDSQRMSTENFLRYLVTECETMVFYEDNKVVAIGIFAGTGRAPSFMAWVAPEYRKGLRNQRIIRAFINEDVYHHAFNTLGLIKLETRICVHNESALRAMKNMRWSLVGISSMDYLINGRLYDSVVLECVNPALLLPVLEEVPHGQRESTRQQSVPDADVDAGSPAEFDGPGVPEQWGDDESALEPSKPDDYTPASEHELGHGSSPVRRTINSVRSWRR